ncbi:MAG: hypothetical protein Q8S13_08730 [Dehalococcoidia bacterium]|nr:hypothetical protein [Dehalococcoidia bacterium]
MQMQPPLGEQWTNAAMNRAARATLAAAHRLAADLLDTSEHGGWCAPDVTQGRAWSGFAFATLTVEHNGMHSILAALTDAVEAARRATGKRAA